MVAGRGVELTLIVCTRDRAPQLRQALSHLARLTTPATFEIVFVDNGSSDGTPEVLASFVTSAGIQARVVRQPTPGLSAARNLGRRQARGALIAFTDDDCYPAPDYLEQLRVCFAEEDLGFLGGRVLLFDQNDHPITIQTLEKRVDIPPRSFVRPGLIHGANFAFRRIVLEQLGDFDERLGAGTAIPCGEDVDALARASALGFPGAYDPRPTVYHHHQRSRPEEVERLEAGYDRGRGAYYAKSLLDRRRRWTYARPVAGRTKHTIGRRDFGVLRREFDGAWRYLRG